MSLFLVIGDVLIKIIHFVSECGYRRRTLLSEENNGCFSLYDQILTSILDALNVTFLKNIKCRNHQRDRIYSNLILINI